MNKTAAIRSQARRSVLVKAAIDPTQIAGALAMAGGGALGGSAVTDDDQSMLKRIGKGTLGAALGYGGYKLMTDPRWQQGLRNGVGTARNLIAGLLGKAQGAAKAAEAQPTPEEQAFAAGFCKAAEAMGVDPEALYKKAALSPKGALRWVMQLGKVAPTTKAPQITGIMGRLQGVGRLSSPVAENLTQMRDLATAMDKYTAARGSATNWLGMPLFPEATLAKGKKFIPQLIEDASRLNGGGPMSANEIDASSAAKRILKMIGYMK